MGIKSIMMMIAVSSVTKVMIPAGILKDVISPHSKLTLAVQSLLDGNASFGANLAISCAEMASSTTWT
jgi:hypothetical protein